MSSIFNSPSPEAPPSDPPQPPAATLPPELLMQIFDEVQDLIDLPAAQQLACIRQGLVCRSWYAARIKRNEFYVANSARARALLRTFERDPERAARVRAISFDREKGHESTAAILGLSTNVEMVSVESWGETAPDALSTLALSVRTLTLNLGGGLEGCWIPDLTSIPKECEIELEMHWQDGAEQGTQAVLEAVTEVAGQVRTLTLIAHGVDFEKDTQRGWLEPLVPRMKQVTLLHTSLWQMHTQSIAPAIAGLDKLECIWIGDYEETYSHELRPQVVLDILGAAHPALNTILIAGLVVSRGGEFAWTDVEKCELGRVCEARGVEVMFADN